MIFYGIRTGLAAYLFRFDSLPCSVKLLDQIPLNTGCVIEKSNLFCMFEGLMCIEE